MLRRLFFSLVVFGSIFSAPRRLYSQEQAATNLVRASAPPKPRDRAEATAVIRELRHIVAPNGIERAESVRIGGINQFVTIRGVDRRNPVLLILHGGPGFPEAPLAWWNTRSLEEYFTVVEWDQRGAGKTYFMNDPVAIAPTMETGDLHSRRRGTRSLASEGLAQAKGLRARSFLGQLHRPRTRASTA